MSQVTNTITYLKACQALRDAGGQVAYTTDPAWLVTMAINRRAGWPDDPSTSRGSARPVNGRYPERASGDRFRHLRLLADKINTPRLIVRASEVGGYRWLLTRIPHRFTTPEEEGLAMRLNGIKITGLHSLQDAGPYNYANSIAGGTHTRFIFARYRNNEYTGESWSGVVRDTELFRLLKRAGYVTKGGVELGEEG